MALLTEWLTKAFGQQVAHKLVVITHMKDAVDAGGHQLFLGITQITGDVLRHKHNTPLAVHDEKEAIQGLEEQAENRDGRQ